MSILDGVIDEQKLTDGLTQAGNILLNRTEDEILTPLIEGKRVKITGTWYLELVDKEEKP